MSAHKPKCVCAVCLSAREKRAHEQRVTVGSLHDRVNTIMDNTVGRSVMLRQLAREMYFSGYKHALEDARIVENSATDPTFTGRAEALIEWLRYMESAL